MKKIIILLFINLSLQKGIAQNVSINATGALPHASAMLDVSAENKGLLLPRTSTTSRLAITDPAIGLILYDSTVALFYFYNGTAWSPISVGGNGWSLTGNAGIDGANNFIGTTDNQPLRFRINNINAGLIDSTLSNTSIGFRTLDSVTTGFSNTALGYKALTSNANGNSNTASGFNSLRFNKSGSGNTANGGYALFLNTNGNVNTANGFAALYSNTIGSNNSASGYYALYNNSIGNYNTASGHSALQTNSTGSNNTASGAKSLFSNTSGNFNTADGANALFLNTTGSNNTAVGETALYSNTEGLYNTANGFAALFSNTIGVVNTANGSQALFSNSIGNSNSAFGYQALYSNTEGNSNVAIGESALYSNSIGKFNTSNGSGALYANTTGEGNTAIGGVTLIANTTGNSNTAIGTLALTQNIGGTNNIAIGNRSGTAVGSPNANNTISIGNYDILNGATNQVIFGNFSSTGYYSNNPWATFSDARIKTNIKEEVKGLDFIMRLNPVTYYKSIKEMVRLTDNKETADFPGKYDVEKIKFSGFLAQEVEQAATASGYEFSGLHKPQNNKDLYALSYESFVVPLVKAMQEQQLMIEKLTKQLEQSEIPTIAGKQQVIIAAQQKQIDLLEKRLAALEAK